jgi:hypothetical protein
MLKLMRRRQPQTGANIAGLSPVRVAVAFTRPQSRNPIWTLRTRTFAPARKSVRSRPTPDIRSPHLERRLWVERGCPSAATRPSLPSADDPQTDPRPTNGPRRHYSGWLALCASSAISRRSRHSWRTGCMLTGSSARRALCSRSTRAPSQSNGVICCCIFAYSGP